MGWLTNGSHIRGVDTLVNGETSALTSGADIRIKNSDIGETGRFSLMFSLRLPYSGSSQW